MEQENIPMEENEGYKARPAWQVWCARIGVVIVLAAFLLYCYHIANGGV